jgi:hypothetical protein
MFGTKIIRNPKVIVIIFGPNNYLTKLTLVLMMGHFGCHMIMLYFNLKESIYARLEIGKRQGLKV